MLGSCMVEGQICRNPGFIKLHKCLFICCNFSTHMESGLTNVPSIPRGLKVLKNRENNTSLKTTNQDPLCKYYLREEKEMGPIHSPLINIFCGQLESQHLWGVCSGGGATPWGAWDVPISAGSGGLVRPQQLTGTALWACFLLVNMEHSRVSLSTVHLASLENYQSPESCQDGWSEKLD